MGQIKLVDILIKNGDYKDFEQSYLKAKQNNEVKFKHGEHEFTTEYGEAVCDLVQKTDLNK